MEKLAMIRKLAWATAAFAMLGLASCNAPGNSPTGARSESDAPPATPAAAPLAEPQPQPAPAAARLPSVAPTAEPQSAPSTPMSGPKGKPGLPPLSLGADGGLSCRSDSDCAVKDAGSCCGYRPVCVNKDTPTFPEKVKAACAKEGRVGICGFQAIDGCQCVAGKCEGVPMMENSVPLQ